MATAIARDWQKTATHGAIAAVIAVATYWLLWRDPGAERPVLLATLLTFAMTGVIGWFVYRAVLRSGFAPCPGCGHMITELSTSANRGVVCRFCGKYVEGAAGKLVLTDEQQIASDWIFETLRPDPVRWPARCCLCRDPATRRLRVQVTSREEAPLLQDLGVRVATLGTLKLVGERTQSLEVPHCDRHEHGAVLKIAADSTTGLAIAFRSHAYLVAFCDANGTLPRT